MTNKPKTGRAIEPPQNRSRGFHKYTTIVGWFKITPIGKVATYPLGMELPLHIVPEYYADGKWHRLRYELADGSIGIYVIDSETLKKSSSIRNRRKRT